MRYGMGYVMQTQSAYTEQVRARVEKQLRRRALELSSEVMKYDPPMVATVE